MKNVAGVCLWLMAWIMLSSPFGLLQAREHHRDHPHPSHHKHKHKHEYQHKQKRVAGSPSLGEKAEDKTEICGCDPN